MKSMSEATASVLVTALVALMAIAPGCRQRMADQPAPRPLTPSAFFPDGRSSRPFVDGTVARGELRDDEALYTGQAGGQIVEELPYLVNREMLDRGRERYDIFCAPCHDRVGEGQGMVVRRGFAQPPTFHSQRLREVRNGYLFDVITRGFGRMPAYAPQIPVADRWAIVSYIRALQVSQHATLEDVPATVREDLMAGREVGSPARSDGQTGDHR